MTADGGKLYRPLISGVIEVERTRTMVIIKEVAASRARRGRTDQEVSHPSRIIRTTFERSFLANIVNAYLLLTVSSTFGQRYEKKGRTQTAFFLPVQLDAHHFGLAGMIRKYSRIAAWKASCLSLMDCNTSFLGVPSGEYAVTCSSTGDWERSRRGGRCDEDAWWNE